MDRISKRYLFSLFLAWVLVVPAFAQDPSSPLLYANPQTVSPSMAGLVQGSAALNLSTLVRRATEDVNYNTSMLSLDVPIRSKLLQGGTGILLSTDKVAGFRTSNFSASFAWEAPLGVKARYNHLRAGIQAGFIQQTLDQNYYTFADQFTGTGFGNTTNEPIATASTNSIAPDFSLGLLYYRTQKIKGNVELNPFFGGAIQHFNRPNLSYVGVYDASRKYNVQIGGKLRTRTPFDISSSLIYSVQNNSQLYAWTTFLTFTFFENNVLFGKEKAALMIGSTVRLKDAISPFLGFNYQNIFSFTAAYDIVVASTPTVPTSYGGFQMMISYRIGSTKYKKQALPFPML